MTDVLLYQTDNDGDVNFANEDLEQTEGIRTAVYLSLFGGNIKDGGHDKTKFEWWGSLGETDIAKRYRSETQHLIQGASPLTANTLLRIEDAVKRDLQWLIDKQRVKTVEVEASSPVVNRLKLVIYADGISMEFWEDLANG